MKSKPWKPSKEISLAWRTVKQRHGNSCMNEKLLQRCDQMKAKPLFERIKAHGIKIRPDKIEIRQEWSVYANKKFSIRDLQSFLSDLIWWFFKELLSPMYIIYESCIHLLQVKFQNISTILVQFNLLEKSIKNEQIFLSCRPCKFNSFVLILYSFVQTLITINIS